MTFRLFVTVWWIGALSVAASPRDPVALVVEAGPGASIVRSGTALPFRAKITDLLFSGDSLTGSATVASCGAANEAVLAKEVRVVKPQPCLLPKISSELSLAVGPGLTRSVTLGDAEAPPFESAIPKLESPERSKLDRSLAAISGNGVYERIARAETLAQFRLFDDAAEEYALLRRDVPDATELATSRIFVLEEQSARSKATKADRATGKTYALLIGVSEFQNAQIRPLKYAHEDALLFEQFLRSPRGGGLAETDITLLTNQQATTAAIRTAFDTILTRATPQDTVIVLLATHGAVVDNPRSRSRGAHIVTYDSDPEDLAATALPMSAVQRFIREDLGKTARVLAFVDACRSGTIGTIPDKSKIKINAALDSLTQSETELFLFTASRPGEVSYEGRQYGGGHGAFSFFLLEALNGGGDFDSDGKVTLNEMVSYVQQKVAEATVDKQHPREGGTLDATVRVADLGKAGIALGTFQPGMAATTEGSRSLTRPREEAVRVVNIRQAVDFDEALSAGRILPDEPANAFTAFRQLKLTRRFDRDQLLRQENRLRVALENGNQQTLLRYLAGDQKPMTRDDYTQAARWISAAMQINGESPSLASRLLFCEGRIAVFDKDYAKARTALENALRLDSESAYIYNALGTAYLEQGEFQLGEKALQEAMQRAPQWAYPRHNLALLLDQRGDSEDAIRMYDSAIQVAPQHSYLVYNQGLMYQRLNRKAEAERRYARAIEMSPDIAEPYNAMGTLRADQGDTAKAEALYRTALSKNSRYLEARQNLASLLSRKAAGREEAILLWRENLALDSQFLPSRLALAQTLEASKQFDPAIVEYRAIVASAPELMGARLQLAALLTVSGNLAGAGRELDEAKRRDPANPLVLEGLGDFEASRGERAQAGPLYRAALSGTADREARKRLTAKIRSAKQ